MPAHPAHPLYADHAAPEGLRTRGTVLVLPGRGETRATYERFGRRLAADAYRVRVLDAPAVGADLGAALDRLARDLADALDGARSEDGTARPVVVVGSDTGAALAAALYGRAGTAGAAAPRIDALVLAGLPGRAQAPADPGDWEAELDVRTSCPAHRRALTDDTGVVRGALGDALPEALLAAAHDAPLDLPALFLAGDADPLADRDELHRTAKALGRARLAVVRGAHHDVLNDLQHRSVAAEVVTFLESLREGLVPLVTVETSAW